MLIKKSKLRQIIREELSRSINEGISQLYKKATSKDRIPTSKVDFEWGKYGSGEFSNEPYFVRPGGKLGSVQFKGDPYTYEELERIIEVGDMTAHDRRVVNRKGPKKPDDMPLDKKWTKAPTSGNYVWVSPDQLKDSFELPAKPAAQTSAGAFRRLLRTKKLSGGKDWYDIASLKKYLYGKGRSGSWAYSQSKSSRAMDPHPKLKIPMLPPGWSIAFEIYKEKLEAFAHSIYTDLDGMESQRDKDEYVKAMGFDSEKLLIAALDKLVDTVQYT